MATHSIILALEKPMDRRNLVNSIRTEFNCRTHNWCVSTVTYKHSMPCNWRQSLNKQLQTNLPDAGFRPGVFMTQTLIGTTGRNHDQCRRPKRYGFDPWVEKDSLKGVMATHSRSLLSWRIHGQKNLAGYHPWSCEESDACFMTYTFEYLKPTKKLDGPSEFFHFSLSMSPGL